MTRCLTLTVLLSVVSSASAQSYPPPGSKTEAPVLCTGCPDVNDGLPTYPYSAPIVDHVGRYVDSQVTTNFQHLGFRTARARAIRLFPPIGSAAPRMYIQIGNAVGSYPLDTFITTKLPAGTVPVSGVKTGSRVGGFGRSPVERIVMWDGFMYPEANASGWYAPLIDQQDPLGLGGSFDVDDRGLVYTVYPTFGWGIARDTGGTSGAHFPKVVQVMGNAAPVNQSDYPNTITDPSSVNGNTILSVRSGGKYYAITASMSKSRAVYDVTTPATPKLVANHTGASNAIYRYDRSDAFSRVAYIDGAASLQVYSYADLVSGGAPIATHSGQERRGFIDVAIDETGTIWAIESTRLLKLTPTGAGYIPTAYTPFGSDFNTMRALAVGAGHIAVSGTARTGNAFNFDVRLAKIEAGGPRLIPTDNFFRNYYHGGAVGYAIPGQYTFPCDLQLFKWNGKTYLMYSAEGLGDVFELVGGSVAPILPSPPVLPPIIPPPPTTVPPVTPPCTCVCTPPCRPPG